MIVTLTLNPAIDMSYRMDELKLNTVNRCNHVIKTPGGKGLNVTRVLKGVGADVCTTGFLGGKTGELIQQELDAAAIHHCFVPIKGNTRHCLALMHEGKQTEILEGGPIISDEEARTFIKTYNLLLDQATLVTASGSLPKGLPKSFYQRLIELATKKNKKFLLDTSGETLKCGIKAQPYLIKPNQEELAAIMGTEINNESDLLVSVKKLAETGIPFIVVSLGKKGALGYVDGHAFLVKPPKINAVNPVGSGDAMIAGLAYGFSRGLSPKEALIYGTVFGTLNAAEERTGSIQADQVEKLKNKLSIRDLK